MKKLITIIALILLLITTILPQTGCSRKAEEVKPTYEELQAIQQETGQVLDELGLDISSDINIEKNQVELYVTDIQLFYKTLEQAGVQLLDHVMVIEVYKPLDEIPFEINPDPSVHFPQLKMRSGSFMEALLYGELVLENGYLRVDGYLVMWQPDYFVNNNEGTIEILDRNGKVVARVDEELCMGGGESGRYNILPIFLKEPLPEDIEGPFWIQGEGTRLNLNFSSDLFSLEVITSGDNEYYFMKKKSPLEGVIGEKVTVTGTLVASRKDLFKCTYISVYTTPEKNITMECTPIWPSDYQARVKDGVLEIIDGDGQVIVRDGEEVRLEGIRLGGVQSEIPRQLNDELPCECYRTYLIVNKILR